MKLFRLKFNGYWLDCDKANIPDCSGIYIIYSCKYNKDNDTVSCEKIIYIGKAENLKDRLANHNEREFSKFLKQGETLCYAYAPVNVADLDLVENALVFAEKPAGNTTLKYHYSHDDAQFTIEGDCVLLKYTFFKIA